MIMRIALHSYRAALLTLMFCTTACGDISIGSADATAENAPNFSASANWTTFTLAFATDYASNGQLYFAKLEDESTALVNTQVTDLGSSANLRIFGDLLFVLHDGFSLQSSDNLQVLDPFDNFATDVQWTTGNGTNPQDVVVQGLRAFISLYNPLADKGNRTNDGQPGDVIEVDLNDGSIPQRYSFHDFLNDDDHKSANAQALLLNDKLYVALQDLDENFSPDSRGKIGIINIQERTVEGVITLKGQNPVSLSINSERTHLIVANMAGFDYTTQTFNTATDFGGIEIIDLQTQTTVEFWNDEDLGGYVEKVITSDDFIYAVVSTATDGAFTSKIVQITQHADGLSKAATFYDNATDVRSLAHHQGHIWISEQNANNENPQIKVLQEPDGIQVGESLTPAVTAMSLMSPN